MPASMITVQVLGALKKGTAKLVAKKAANRPPLLRLGCNCGKGCLWHRQSSSPPYPP